MYWGWHPLQGVYLHNWGVASTSAASNTGGCTFIAGGVHTRTHVYWGCHPLQGVYLHNWGVASTSAASTTGVCTFIAGGVYTRMHLYWGWHPLQGVYLHNWGVASTSAASTTGGVPSSLGVCIPGHMCTGGGIHYRGCTFITAGWHPPVLHPLQGGVPSSLGVCIPGCMCTGGVPSLEPVKNIYSLKLKQRFVYETIFIKLKVH